MKLTHKFQVLAAENGQFAYLRPPDACIGARMGANVFPNALPTVGTLGKGAAGPVFLHVGTTLVEPTVAGYEPTEGATTDPYPPVPSACASANVVVRVKAVANTIVVSFMVVSFSCRLDRRQPHRLLDRSTKIFFKRDGSRPSCSHLAEPHAPAVVFHRCKPPSSERPF